MLFGWLWEWWSGTDTALSDYVPPDGIILRLDDRHINRDTGGVIARSYGGTIERIDQRVIQRQGGTEIITQ